MNNEVVMRLLADAGAIITDSHIVYTSGRHGKAYVNKDALYVHTGATSQLCAMIADHYNADRVDIVIGPTIGGVVLSQWVAHHLSAKRSAGEVMSVYAEKEGEGEDKKLVIKRGYDQLVSGKNVLVVEDVLTTGGSARKVVEAVRALDGKVIGLSVLCNRGGVKPSDVGDVPLLALTTVTMDSWPEEECTLCKEGVPVNTSLGKGKAFLEKRQAAV
jgi:orotate phosphoribosyltransferase